MKINFDIISTLGDLKGDLAGFSAGISSETVKVKAGWTGEGGREGGGDVVTESTRESSDIVMVKTGSIEIGGAAS